MRDLVQLKAAEIGIFLELRHGLQQLEMNLFAALIAPRKHAAGGENRLVTEAVIGMKDAIQAGDHDLFTGAEIR
jgi:hypothetical protein